MKQGADVLVQASLQDGQWMGYADILLKVPRKSKFGNWFVAAIQRYEVNGCLQPGKGDHHRIAFYHTLATTGNITVLNRVRISRQCRSTHYLFKVFLYESVVGMKFSKAIFFCWKIVSRLYHIHFFPEDSLVILQAIQCISITEV